MASKSKPGGWLFKEEPGHYSYEDLERDGLATWDGVDNALARQHLRQVKPGDHVLYYHTGREKAIVGEMRVVAGPQADPDSDDPNAVVVQVAPVRRWKQPLSLARIKACPALSDWELVRLPRLSVMPVTPVQWKELEQLLRMTGE
jgi:predicted RNA-binding protein with PUA-like domain